LNTVLNGNRDSEATAAEQIKTKVPKSFHFRMLRSSIERGVKKVTRSKDYKAKC
jgi:hypothetical protein